MSNYFSVHARARKVLPGVCTFADDTCHGRLECALRKDAPADLIRTDVHGLRYFIGDDSSQGYMRLCASHHDRYDGHRRETSGRSGGISGRGTLRPHSPEHRTAIANGWTPERKIKASKRMSRMLRNRGRVARGEET